MGLAGCDLRVVVGPTGALTHAYLGERDDVQREVELPITTAWQTVSRVVAAGDLDRCDAGIAGERGGAAEPARTTSPPEQPPRDDGTDAGDIAQSGAVRVEGVRESSDDAGRRSDAGQEFPR